MANSDRNSMLMISLGREVCGKILDNHESIIYQKDMKINFQPNKCTNYREKVCLKLITSKASILQQKLRPSYRGYFRKRSC